MGIPSCVMFNSVLQNTRFNVIVVCISPGRFGCVEFVRVADAFVGRQFEKVPPKEWLLPVVKLVNDIL